MNQQTKDNLPCPFCGKHGTARAAHTSEFYGPSIAPAWAIFCDAIENGCGAGTGFQDDIDIAWLTWNRRRNSA